MIKRGVPEEEIRTFTIENGLASTQIDTQSYEVPIFTPPADNDIENQPTINEDTNKFQINEFGEIERPVSKLETLAQQKAELQDILKERQTELQARQATIGLDSKRRDSDEKS